MKIYESRNIFIHFIKILIFFNFVKSVTRCIDVGDVCWRQNVLLTNFNIMLSTMAIVYIYISIRNQYSKDVINIEIQSTTSTNRYQLYFVTNKTMSPVVTQHRQCSSSLSWSNNARILNIKSLTWLIENLQYGIRQKPVLIETVLCLR